MSKLGKSRKIGISVVVACCMLLAIIFFADIKNLFVLAADALSALISTDATTDTSTTIVMRTDDAYDVYETDGYYAFSVYAPSTATYTIGVTAENGSVRVNTGEAISVNGTEMSVSLTEGTNVLYIMGCSSPSIQWERETCDLEPINKVCALLAGDLDQDGERTLLELIRLKKEAAVAGTLTTDTLARTEIADIDWDNSITNEDARLLRELLVGNPRYEASELRAVIVDAYLVDSTTNTAVLYDTLADAFTAASTESTANSNKEVTVTVVKPTDVYITEKIVLDGGVNILLTDDGATDNGWSRTITRASTLKEEMFAVAEATLTLDGSSDSDEHSSLILDGGAISASSNHFVDVGNANYNEAATLIMDKGVKLTNNVNTGQGGAIAVQTRFIMNGGIISGNLANGAGGAIVLLGSTTKNEVTVPAATMTMSGGIITENESTKELYSSGGVSISGGATLNMTGGEIYNNITPVSLDNNSVRKSGTSSVFTMGDNAYVDRVCFDTTGVNTHCVELTSKLTTTKDITLFFTQPLNSANPVVKRDSSISECDALFKLSEHMVPCQLVQDDSNENLCLRSDVTDMETVVVGEEPVYSSSSDSAFQALGISGSNWTVQGVCADDTYLYMAIAQSPSLGCRILKVELGTWKYVDCSDEMLLTDHSNEMTYNPNTGRIYITHCISEGTGNTTDKTGPYAISIVDPANLNVLEDTIYLSDSSAYTGTTGISALAYNATQDYYVASGTGFRFGFLKGATGEDDTYSITETAMPSTGLKGFTGYTAYTKQGVYATDTTIYTNTWYDITNVTGEEQNFLTIYDWSGNYHGTQYIVNLDGSAFTREIESMFEYNGTMYMACFPKDYSVVAEVYALSDVGKAESTIEVQDSTGAVVDGVYTNLASAIAKANELGTATLILKEDVTVGAKQTITGNVTIKDDGTARTITRGAAYKGQMFVTDSSSASLTLQATGTDKDNPTLILDGNGVQKCNAMISLEKSSGTLSVTGPVKFTNAHINQNGGIIRTVSGEASITIDGAVFAGNTVVTETLNGGLINVLGTSKVTIKDTAFYNNVISSSGAVKGAILYVNGGTTNVVGSAFTSNITTTTDAGGGLLRIDSGTLNIGKYTDEDGTTIVEGACTFTNNSFTASAANRVFGGVISLGDDASAQVYNSTFTSNTAECGNISLNNGATLTIGDSELSNNLTTSTTEPDSKDIRATGTSGKVIVEGKVKTTVYCNNSNKLQIGSQLEAGSEITITGSTAVISEGKTLVSFMGDNVADVMADCRTNGYLKVASEDYTLVYDTTDNTAKLASVVATMGEEKYASLADAITAANALETTAEVPATIVLKANVTVGEMSNITGNVTITDDGTARTITREEGFTNQMFLVADGAGLTFTATGEDKTSPTLTIDGNGEVAGPSGAMVSLGTGNGTLAVNHAVRFTNANINEDGGIIRTEDGSTAIVAINGGVFDNNTAERTDAVSGGLIKVVGEAEVTISNALFQNNTIKSTEGALKGGIMYVGGGTVNVVGSTFISNTAYTENTGAGGVIAVYGGTLNVGKYVNAIGETIEGDCYFTDNTFSSSNGYRAYGGVFTVSGGSANVCKSTATGNSADYGGVVSVGGSYTLTVEDCTFQENEALTESYSKDIRAAGTVIFKGKVNTTVYCSGANRLQVNSLLTEGSQITVVMSGWVDERIVVTFASEEIMADCKENGYLVLTNKDYALNYATSDSTYIAKLTSAVATIGEQGYASLADAIEAANALDSATIVLKTDVTVDATQTITGNVTITDDGTAKTLARGAECTAQMFDVQEGASLTLAGTEETAEDGTVQGTITVDGNKTNVTATASMINNAGTFTLGTNASLTNAGNENVTKGGVLYNTGSTTLEGTLSGNEAERGGALYNEGGTVTFNEGTFSENKASVHGAVIFSLRGTVDITGGTFTSNEATNRGGVILANGEAVVTITDGEFTGNKAHSTATYGGGVFSGTQNTTLNITGGTFTNNQATSTTSTTGGGVIESNGTVNISGGTFEGNTAFKGGVVFMNGNATSDIVGELTISAGEFYSNKTHNATDAAGGVVYIKHSTLAITGGTFGAEGKGNVSYQRGGAIYVEDRDAAPAEANISIKNVTFSYNSAQHGEKASGGVVFVGKNSIVNIDSCTFGYNEIVDTNTSTNGIYYLGGVIYASASDINVTNTTFNNNSTKRGGALYITGADIELSNCEFIDNEGTAFGKDIFFDNGSLTLSGKMVVHIDKRAQTIQVTGTLGEGSLIQIGQVSGSANAFVQFETVAAMQDSQTNGYIKFVPANNQFTSYVLYYDETNMTAGIQASN